MYDTLHDLKEVKVRDYCHVTSKYRGLVHDILYINLQLDEKDTYHIS